MMFREPAPVPAANGRRTRWLQVVAFLLAASAFLLATSLMQPKRVGDGDEYYAMQLAWSVDHRPYMRETSWQAYQKFYESDVVSRLAANSTRLAKKFPALTIDGTTDFNHFWFYPMLAAAIDLAAGGPDAGLSVHGSFMVLHSLLFALALVLSWRWHGGAGLAAAVLLVIGSPALWSMDKVHPEFITVCLGVVAVAAAMGRRWPAAALTLALASTQNISFALPAFAAGCLALWTIGRGRRWPKLWEIALLTLSAVVVLLHPVYYYSRYGVVTPQLLAGGASIDNNNPLRGLWFLFDLDLGLLPNWPAGFAFLLLGAVLLLRCRPKPDWRLLGFLSVYLLANLVAHGGTINLNSGASVQVSRYSLWYVALFFPAVVWLFRVVSGRLLSLPVKLLAVVTPVVLATVNVMQYHPMQDEDYLSPSWSSRLVYSRFPGLIDPNPEIFTEKHAGAGETSAVPPPSVVLGPECRKLLLTGWGRGEPKVFGRDSCDMHIPSLLVLLQRRNAWAGGGTYIYTELSRDEIVSLFGSVLRGSTFLAWSRAGDLHLFLVSGWGRPEDWGVWSVGQHAAIEFSLREDPDTARDLEISLLFRAFLPKGHPRLEVGVKVNDVVYPDLVVDPRAGFPLRYRLWLPGDRLRATGGRVRMELHVRNPVSPKEAGISNDPRELGLGLLEMTVE